MRIALFGLEKALNRYLALDPEALRTLSSLNSSVVCIQISDWNTTLYVVFHAHSISLHDHWHKTPTATLRAPLFAFLRTAASSDKKRAALTHQVHVAGDALAAEAVMLWSQSIDIDWEEHLSHLLGDSLAHALGKRSKTLFRILRQTRQSLFESATEYWQNEANLLPTSEEVEDFHRELALCRDHVERLEARLQPIETHLQDPS